MRRLTIWKIRLLMFLAVVGPGFITANVDNDAGGIYTYSIAGAKFGYGLLWTVIPMTISLIVVQEIAARMGAVTGKGLSDLIREEYGFRITFLMMAALVATWIPARRAASAAGSIGPSGNPIGTRAVPEPGTRQLGHPRLDSTGTRPRPPSASSSTGSRMRVRVSPRCGASRSATA